MESASNQDFCRRILSLHERYLQHAANLPSNLGDGCLYARNRTFRAMRDLVLARGYAFATTGSAVNTVSDSVPLLALPIILATKTIPYRDNVTGLSYLMQRLEMETVTAADFQQFVRGNVLLHESAHCVAADALGSMKYERGDDRLTDVEILGHLLAEAYANAIEVACALETETAIDRFFFSCNSYAAIPPVPVYEAAARLRGANGPALIRVLFFGFLASNYLRDDFMEESLRRALPLMRLPADAGMDDARTVFEYSTTLDRQFRTRTTVFFLRTVGAPADVLDRLTAFRYEDAILHRADLRDRVDSLLALT
jgi:hypothetical protein